MPGNSQRKGAVRARARATPPDPAAGSAAGWRARARRPKAEDRPYHAAHKRARRRRRRTAAGGPRTRSADRSTRARARSGWPAATRWWRRCGPVPGQGRVRRRGDRAATTGCARHPELAADRGIALLEVTRAELDRLTGGAVHQGVALQLPAYDYAHPDDLLGRRRWPPTSRPLIVALDGVTDPRNLGAIIRSAAAFGAHGVLIPERRAAG